MRDTVKIDWRVPADEWHRFEEYVLDSFGTTENGYMGREAEIAMKAYADTDGYARVEEQLNQLLEAAGHTLGDSSQEKKFPSDAPLANAEKTRVTIRVHETVKDDFKTVAKDSDDSYGVEFARALREHREGGRAGRMERRLDTIIEDVERIVSEIGSNVDASAMSTEEKRTVKVCQSLSDEFLDDELVEAIQREAKVSSAPSIEKYRKNVLEWKGMEPHPANSDLYVTTEEAEALATDGEPEEVRRPVWFLDSDEQVKRVHLMLGHRAAKRSSGVARFTPAEVRDIVFNRELSESDVRDRVDDATRTEGYRMTSVNGVTKLEVDLSLIRELIPSDDELLELHNEIIAYRDGVDLEDHTAGTTLGDFTTDQSVAADGSGDSGE